MIQVMQVQATSAATRSKDEMLNHEKTILQQASEVDACAIGLIISNHEQCRLIMNDQA